MRERGMSEERIPVWERRPFIMRGDEVAEYVWKRTEASVKESDIEAVVRRLFPERPILGDMTTFWPRGMLPECEAGFREWWGRMGLRVERIGDTATARLVKIEAADRPRDIPPDIAKELDTSEKWAELYDHLKVEYDRLYHVEAAAREAVKSNGAAFWIAMHHLTEVLEAK